MKYWRYKNYFASRDFWNCPVMFKPFLNLGVPPPFPNGIRLSTCSGEKLACLWGNMESCWMLQKDQQPEGRESLGPSHCGQRLLWPWRDRVSWGWWAGARPWRKGLVGPVGDHRHHAVWNGRLLKVLGEVCTQRDFWRACFATCQSIQGGLLSGTRATVPGAVTITPYGKQPSN